MTIDSVSLDLGTVGHETFEMSPVALENCMNEFTESLLSALNSNVRNNMYEFSFYLLNRLHYCKYR